MKGPAKRIDVLDGLVMLLATALGVLLYLEVAQAFALH